MTIANDLRAAKAVLDAGASTIEGQQTTIGGLEARVSELEAALADCQSTEPPEPEPTTEVHGTLVLRQVSNASQLEGLRTQIGRAMDYDVAGLSVRYPWTGSSRELYETAASLAGNRFFTPRFMAGRWVPQTGVELGRTIQVAAVGGGKAKCPVPFNTDGTPNLKFVASYTAQAATEAALCREFGCPILHLPWFGKDWAEIANDATIRGLEGYSQDAFFEAHRLLVDAALPLAGPDLAIEFPMSGSGDLPWFIRRMTTYIAGVDTAGRVIVQGNGVDADGVWGAPNQQTEQAKDEALDPRVAFACQMIQPQAFDWAAVYGQVRRMGGRYLEVYLESFAMGDEAALAREITAFAGG